MSTNIQYDSKNQTIKIQTDPQTKKYEPLLIFDDNNPLLSEVMPEFDFTKPVINPKELSERLKITMKTYGGIGLSSNQCGIKCRAFVIGVDDNSITCFNPVITEFKEGETVTKEGCLSFPGLYLSVRRPNVIKGYYYNETGKKIDFEYGGITSKCFQHELDHLNGIKFTKYVGEVGKHLAKQRQKKIIRKFKKQNKNLENR